MNGKAKWSFCLAIIAVFAAPTAHADVTGIDSANTLYGSVVITAGGASEGIDSAEFNISGGGFSASSSTAYDILGDHSLSIQAPGQLHISGFVPTIGTNLANGCSGGFNGMTASAYGQSA